MENAIGRMRRFLPRKTDLATLTQERFCQLVQAYNNTPRKCLGYNTPAEVFSSQVLHFKCESTFLPAQERRVGINTQVTDLFRGSLEFVTWDMQQL